MYKLVGLSLLIAGSALSAMAQVQTPEIGADSAGSALALVAGVLIVWRGRRKQ